MAGVIMEVEQRNKQDQQTGAELCIIHFFKLQSKLKRFKSLISWMKQTHFYIANHKFIIVLLYLLVQLLTTGGGEDKQETELWGMCAAGINW